jgi:lipoic acid synthetase
MSNARPQAGIKLRDDEKVKHIPVTIIPTEKEEMLRKPEWIKIKLPRTTEKIDHIKQTLRKNNLHSVCEEASCPNLAECFNHGTATFMILGDICTRSCGFCNVRTGKPSPPDYDEPEKVGKSIFLMDLRHIVITCVDRDDLVDGGAQIWAETIRAVNRHAPKTSVECLIGDFQGDEKALGTVMNASPHILAHNLETVPRMHKAVRPQAKYERSMQVLSRIRNAGLLCKRKKT